MQILGPTSDLRIRISDGGLAQGSVFKQILQIILKLILLLIFEKTSFSQGMKKLVRLHREA